MSLRHPDRRTPELTAVRCGPAPRERMRTDRGRLRGRAAVFSGSGLSAHAAVCEPRRPDGGMGWMLIPAQEDNKNLRMRAGTFDFGSVMLGHFRPAGFLILSLI